MNSRDQLHFLLGYLEGLQQMDYINPSDLKAVLTIIETYSVFREVEGESFEYYSDDFESQTIERKSRFLLPISLDSKERQPYYFFFDTETSGLPKDWKAPVYDLDNWPRIVQIAYEVYTEDGEFISKESFIVRPDDFIIPAEASAVHGITTERARREGSPTWHVLSQVYDKIGISTCLVAHNMSYDGKVLGAEFLRNDFDNVITEKQCVCTMETTIDFCGIKNAYGNKFPSLKELYFKLFRSSFEEAHDAAADLNATVKCFWELKKLGYISR